jgi:hypothetical protein
LIDRGHQVTLLQPGQTPPFGAHVLVAGGSDIETLAGRRMIHIEHGAGQSYDGDPEAAGQRGYPGGDGYETVVLFICPNDKVVEKWRSKYPDTPAVAVGCPMLDRWHTNPPAPERPRVALTFHWPSTFCPEAGTAWAVYQRPIAERLVPLALEHGWSIVGHEHPRWQGQLMTSWKTLGIPTVNYDTVMDTATLLVADNTSFLPEFASTGRPVLWLNSPEWRRDVHHGGRFWEWPEGQIVCEHPRDLATAVANAMLDPLAVHAARDRMVESIYLATDGKAAARAADAIEQTLG